METTAKSLDLNSVTYIGVASDVSSSDMDLQLNASGSLTLNCPRLTERLIRTSTLTTVFVVAYAAIFVCGIIANVLVVGIVASKRSLQTTTNFFIVNLAIADLFVLVFVLPITLLTSVFDGWEYGTVACKAVPYVQGVSVCASINSITAIAFDRYFAICHSFSAVPLRQHMRLIVSSVWVLAMAVMVPWLYVYDLNELPNSVTGCPIVYCGQHWPGGRLQEGVFYVVAIFALCYGLPLITITVVYLFIVCHVWRSDGPLLAGSIKSGHALRQSRRQVLRMILVLSVFFALSWLPFHVIYLTYYFRPAADVLEFLSTAQPFAQLLSASNSCVNPIIYSFVSRKWRSEFSHICSIMFATGGRPGHLAMPAERRMTNRLTSNAGSECGLAAAQLAGKYAIGGGGKIDSSDVGCDRKDSANNVNYNSVRLAIRAPKTQSSNTA